MSRVDPEDNVSTASGAINAFFNHLAAGETIDQARSAANEIIKNYNDHYRPEGREEMEEMTAVCGNGASGGSTFADILKP